MSLKISSYLADFKNIKKQSRIDIIFLLIFFFLLFIPMSKINQEKISKEENRTLAVYKPLIKHAKINYNFGKNYDKWFSDRFCLRKNIIEWEKLLTFIINVNPTGGMIDKQTGFQYMDWEFRHYNISTIKKNFEYINKLNDFCNQNQIKLYILITPQKSDIYPPATTNYIINTENHNKFISYIQELNKKNELKIIYPLDELKTATSDNFMFFKTEHHWTDDAAFIAYKTLMKEIRKDYPFIKEVNKDDYDLFYSKKVRGDFDRKFKLGTTGNRIHIPENFQKKYHNVNYRYYKNKNFNMLDVETIIKNPKKQKNFYYPYGENLKVIMLGTSQNENLTEFVPFTFKYTKRMRLVEGSEKLKYMKHYEKEILDYKPDILIYGITYSGINSQKNLFLDERE